MKTKKNILITIDWFLPGTDSGGPVRSCANFIAHLSQDFNFYVITRDTDYCASHPYTSIESNSWNTIESGAQVYYCSSDRVANTHLTKLFKEKTFDTIYINGVYSWYFSILPLLVFKNHPRVIVASRGMLNPQAFSVKPLKKRVYLALAKTFGLYNTVRFHATNTQEKKHVLHLLGKNTSVIIAPNMPRVSKAAFTEKAKNSVPSFINLARISPEKGTLKMLEAFLSIKTPVTLDLYGPVYDQPYWDTCLSVIQKLPSLVKVTYKGIAKSQEVPELLKAYDFFIMLSEGENFGHAILEAFSAGVPVIISNKTPWSGLQEKNTGWDIDANNTNLLDQVLNQACDMSSKEYTQMSKTAYNFAKQFVNDTQLLKSNKSLFDDFAT
ncbi:MAG: glycosyltransferase [Flavobacteriales bacterium]